MLGRWKRSSSNVGSMTMAVYTPNIKMHGKNGLLSFNKELQGQEADDFVWYEIQYIENQDHDDMRQVDIVAIGNDLIQLTSETLHRLPPAIRPDE
jgi:hypothetical protein